MPSIVKVQVIGGAFQDAAGNPLASGYLLFELNSEGVIRSGGFGVTTNVVAPQNAIKILLDTSGNVSTSPAQFLWPNADLASLSSAGEPGFYMVSAYTANGQLVWGPNAQQVLSSPSPFNLNAWVPGIVNFG